MSQRIEKLRKFLVKSGLDAMIVSSTSNRRYFSGFTGSTANLVITQDKAYFVTDFRYLEQAKAQCSDFEVVDVANHESYNNFYKGVFTKANSKKIGAEGAYLTFETYVSLQKSLEGFQIIETNIDNIRMIKDRQEVDLIIKANQIAEKAFAYVLKNGLKVGVSEIFLANLLEAKMKEYGASASAFDIIVASGNRGAMPHGVASQKLIENGDFITFDFGCVYESYCSDITRTVVIGEIKDKELKKIYDVVLQAQKLSVAAVKPGVSLGSVDRAARDYITAKGYGDKFGHSTGHGLGMDVHEIPRVYHPVQDLVEVGMVFTIEPGIYVPGLGGVRIEDDIYVTKDGCEVLTSYNKELVVIK